MEYGRHRRGYDCFYDDVLSQEHNLLTVNTSFYKYNKTPDREREIVLACKCAYNRLRARQ